MLTRSAFRVWASDLLYLVWTLNLDAVTRQYLCRAMIKQKRRAHNTRIYTVLDVYRCKLQMQTSSQVFKRLEREC